MNRRSRRIIAARERRAKKTRWWNVHIPHELRTGPEYFAMYDEYRGIKSGEKPE